MAEHRRKVAMPPVIARRGTLRAVWLCAVASVIAASLLPGSSPAIQMLDAIEFDDLVEHFAAYAALAFLPALHERRGAIPMILAALMAMGVALEFGQLQVQGRSFETADMAADAAGLLVGLAAGLAARPRLRAAFDGPRAVPVKGA